MSPRPVPLTISWHNDGMLAARYPGRPAGVDEGFRLPTGHGKEFTSGLQIGLAKAASIWE